MTHVRLQLITLSCLFALAVKAEVINGQADLSGIDGELRLNGNWSFYEGIIDPNDIGNASSDQIKVPSYWPINDGQKGYGSGLYHVKVVGVTQDLLAIRLGRVHTSYVVWINDQLIHQSGQPTIGEEGNKPGIDNKPIVFSPPGETFDLYIGVSNFQHARGGIVRQVVIGDATTIQDAWMSGLITEIIWVAIIFAIAVVTLLLFIIGHRQIAYLYFALFCFFSILRLITIEHLIVGAVFPEVPYWFIATFRYVGFFISGAFIGLYCEKLVPTSHRHWVIKLIIYAGFICSAGIVITPFWIGTYISMLFQAITFVSFVGFYILLAKAMARGRRDLLLVGLSITSIVIGFTHDVLVVIELVPWQFWQIPGFVFACSFQLLYFAVEYKSLNERVDSLLSNFTSLGIIHKEKSEFEHVLINEIKDQLGQGRSDDEFLRTVLKKINRGPSIPANQKVTIEAVDKVNQEFLLKLKKRFPDLTQKEIELCLSIKAKLSSKEIAGLRNITAESVKKARSRLRQKLGLPKETDLYQFFEDFS